MIKEISVLTYFLNFLEGFTFYPFSYHSIRYLLS